MTAYIIRRLGISVVVVILVSIVTFEMLHIIAPSPAVIVLGFKANKVSVAAWNKSHGFDRPVIEQYWSYMWGLLHGNLGWSYKQDQSVASLIGEYWGRSALLSGVSLALAVGIAIPLGIFQAVKRNSLADNALTGAAFTAYAMPVFFLGIILIQVFALNLNWFPAVDNSANTSMAYILTHPNELVLPIATLTLVTVANFSRYMRSSALDTLAQDYIKVARAKGLPERLVLLRHLLRNASLPMVTLIGLFIPVLLAGNLIVETVFNFPGLGLMFYNALSLFDYNVLLAYTLIGAILTVVGNLIADISIAVADPRVRYA
jgi:peptide/nickel transport system permease protein